MPDLIAQGESPHHRWRRRIPYDRTILLGRQAGTFSVPWDDHISRRHISARWENGKLHVERQASARNPVYLHGGPVDFFEIRPGNHFVIGSTTFTLVDEPVDVTIDPPSPVTEKSYSEQFLKQVEYRHQSSKISALGRLPDLIAGAASDDDLFSRVVNLLMVSISRASTVAIVERKQVASDTVIRVRHWDRRTVTGKPFRPSQQLVLRALQTGNSVLHEWDSRGDGQGANFTVVDDIGWAFASPIRSSGESDCVIYVAGESIESGSSRSGTGGSSFQEDIKFTELVASTIADLFRLRELERGQTSLRQFFSPVVLEALTLDEGHDVLAPRECHVSVMFCDLQGFSRRSEQMSGDLMGLLDRVSRILGVTTRRILDHGGVVGDFHGDAAMGFWGWPLETGEEVTSACLAALDIRRSIEMMRQEQTLADFEMGLGVASGPAVAGRIGTDDQVKVTVFGPVVNLAARLESMTRRLHAPILIDEPTADQVREMVPSTIARVRRVAPILPYGMETPLMVHELLPPLGDGSLLTDGDLANYESALEALLQREWSEALKLLHEVPAEDEVKDFLTVFIAQHNRRAPDGWDGIIKLDAK